jgi:hypothetical protein
MACPSAWSPRVAWVQSTTDRLLMCCMFAAVLCVLCGVQVVNDVLSGCDSLDTKQQCMAAILRATPQVRGCSAGTTAKPAVMLCGQALYGFVAQRHRAVTGCQVHLPRQHCSKGAGRKSSHILQSMVPTCPAIVCWYHGSLFLPVSVLTNSCTALHCTALHTYSHDLFCTTRHCRSCPRTRPSCQRCSPGWPSCCLSVATPTHTCC